MTRHHGLRRLGIVLAGVTLAALAGQAAADKKVYRWVDENGRVQFGDKIPPEAAKREAAALDKNGRVRGVRAREMTPQEAAAAAEKARADQEQAVVDAKKKAYERALMMTYGSVADLQLVRDERLTTLDQRIVAADKSVADQEAALAELHGRVPEGKKPTAEQEKLIGSTEDSLAEALKARGQLREERERTAKQFADDIERFKELKKLRG